MIDGHKVSQKDQARIDPVTDLLKLTSENGADIILIDIRSCRGWGISRINIKWSTKVMVISAKPYYPVHCRA